MSENPYKNDRPTLQTELLELAWIALVDELIANGQLDPVALSERLKKMSNDVSKNSPFLAGGLLCFAHLDQVLKPKYGLEREE